MIMLWRNKKTPWNWLMIDKVNYGKSFFFYISRAPHNYWMWHPRIFIWFNFLLISFCRDNCNIKFGLGFGKNHYQIIYHH
jgi:hypothetical protein